MPCLPASHEFWYVKLTEQLNTFFACAVQQDQNSLQFKSAQLQISSAPLDSTQHDAIKQAELDSTGCRDHARQECDGQPRAASADRD